MTYPTLRVLALAATLMLGGLAHAAPGPGPGLGVDFDHGHESQVLAGGWFHSSGGRGGGRRRTFGVVVRVQ